MNYLIGHRVTGYHAKKFYSVVVNKKIIYLCGLEKIEKMKKGIHPEYKEVVFHDTQSDHKFITRSTIKTKDTIKMEDGKTYPLVKIEVSSASHPFYTGKKIFVDTAGRVEKFNRRYKK
jgi:large subunit ribosomal protein L31